MQYQFDDFNRCLNQRFNLELEGSAEPAASSSYPLTLISVDRHPGSASVSEHDPFSVVFRGEGNDILDQQIYRIKHDTLGDMELFIVPIGPDEEGMRYEAVFA